MKLFIQIFILLICLKSRSQVDFKDTTWYDGDWKVSTKTNAKFYRVYKRTEKGFVVYDKYLNGNTQMMAEASAIKPDLIMEGNTIYYNENGTKSSKGISKNDKKTGIWVTYFDNEKDSSVTSYKEDGSTEMIRRSEKDEIYTIVETQAEFPGGLKEMYKFIQTNLKYPEVARKLSLGGKAFLKFVVNEDGNISNVEIIKGTGNDEMDEEAIRVVKLMPKWKPASMTGKEVKCYFNLPLIYSLTEPFYTYNLFSKNEQYLKIAKLIFTGKASDAYFLVKDMDDNETDVDFLYNKAVLYYSYTNKNKSCKYFKKVTEIADQSASTYKNSLKFYNQYCN